MLAIWVLLVCASTASAYPGWWLRQAACIRFHESGGRWTLRNAPYAGAYEFNVGTWLHFVPHGWPRDPASASPRQQTFVAWLVWQANGRAWGHRQWPNTSRICGVR